MSASKISEEEIRETLYNTMLEIALKYNKTDFTNQLTKNFETRQNALRKLISETIIEICKSAKSNGIPTIRNNTVTELNVHPNFVELFIGLNKLRQSKNQIEYNTILSHMIIMIEKKDIFKVIIEQFIKFYLESQKESKTVSVELIRATFYNMMVEQVLVGNTINKQALEDQESFIFYDLSAYVIIESILLSKKYNGILLQGNSIVIEETCPDEYKKFYKMLINLKNKMIEMKLNDDEMTLIKLNSSSNPEVVIPPELIKLKTPYIISLISIIKDMAIQISQIPYFRSIIDSVIKYCIDAM
ncbi:MAG: hypothetical protein Edafosvirus7_11 [Edafosvirus sp.]|uniref:Uncharacterized protein n=1 Tax=Edafosvirus sp. TaxID=2487765 RepID=A0A3G4ZXS1_9VIRU|nr:MAG: hypothetical protein Edafosvirus7_11 [Edafosvirus sp.]